MELSIYIMAMGIYSADKASTEVIVAKPILLRSIPKQYTNAFYRDKIYGAACRQPIDISL